MSSRVELDGRRLVLRVLNCQMLVHTCAIDMINAANRTRYSHAFHPILCRVFNGNYLPEGVDGELKLGYGDAAGNNVLRLRLLKCSEFCQPVAGQFEKVLR